MPQHDYDIANGSGAAFRADLNLALAAIASTNKGPTPPPAPQAGMLWVEDDNPSATQWTVRMYDGADWIAIGVLDAAANTFTPSNALLTSGGILTGALVFPAGSASTPAVTTTGDTNTGMFFPAADQIAFAEGGAEAVRIDASGQVGIGTSTPIRRLTVAQSGSPEFVLQDTSQGTDLKNWRIINASQVLAIGTLNDAGTSGVETLVLDRSGNLRFNSGYGSVSTAYAARAWVNFNGQGTVAIRSSGGVSSITDNSNGNFTINLSFTMPDTNYSFVGLIRKDDANPGDLIGMNPFSTDTKSTTAVQVRTQFRGATYGYFDPPEVNVAIFR